MEKYDLSKMSLEERLKLSDHDHLPGMENLPGMKNAAERMKLSGLKPYDTWWEMEKYIHTENTTLCQYKYFHTLWIEWTTDALSEFIASEELPKPILQSRAIPPVKKVPVYDMFDYYDDQFKKVIYDATLQYKFDPSPVNIDYSNKVPPIRLHFIKLIVSKNTELSSSWKEVDLSSLPRGTPEFKEELCKKINLFHEHQNEMRRYLDELIKFLQDEFREAVLRQQRENFDECDRREQAARARGETTRLKQLELDREERQQRENFGY
jgi:hypothetical protein